MRSKLLSLLLLLVASVAAQTINSSLYQDLRYRNIGPFRAGRTVGAVGVPTQPNVFYIGVNNGGVWKTDGDGRTWKSIFNETWSNSFSFEFNYRVEGIAAR